MFAYHGGSGMRFLKKVLTTFGVISTLSLPIPAYAQNTLSRSSSEELVPVSQGCLEYTPVPFPWKEKTKALDEIILQDQGQNKETGQNKEKKNINPYLHFPSPVLSFDFGTSLTFAYTIPQGYSFTPDGLHKDNSDWRWSFFDGEFYYQNIPLRASFDSLNGFDSNYKDLVTVDGVPLRTHLTMSDASLQQTWNDSFSKLWGTLEDIYVPDYAQSFADQLARKLSRRFQEQRNEQGEINLNGYSVLIPELVSFTEKFYAHGVSPEDKKRTEEAWNEFLQTWQEIFPNVDKDALLVHPLQRINIGSASLGDWLRLFKGAEEMVEIELDDNYLRVHGEFLGRGKGHHELYSRYVLPDGEFTQLFTTSAWLWASGKVDIKVLLEQGISPLQLAGYDALFPQLEEVRIEIPKITAEGEASYKFRKNIVTSNLFEQYLAEQRYAITFGLLDSLGFYNNEFGEVTANLNLDPEKKQADAAYTQDWNRQQVITRGQFLYLSKNFLLDHIWGAGTVGMLQETEQAVREERHALFSALAQLNNSFTYDFTYERKIIPERSRLNIKPQLNFLGGMDIPLFNSYTSFSDASSDTPFFSTLSIYAGELQYPEPIVLGGLLVQFPYLTSHLSFQQRLGYRYALEELEEKSFLGSETYLALKRENIPFVAEYLRKQLLFSVLPRMDGSTERNALARDLYSSITGPLLLATTKEEILGAQLVWGFQPWFFGAGYEGKSNNLKNNDEENNDQKNNSHELSLLTGAERFFFTARYGFWQVQKQHGSNLQFSLQVPLQEQLGLVAEVQPLYPRDGYDVALLNQRDSHPSDFRAMVKVLGRF